MAVEKDPGVSLMEQVELLGVRVDPITIPELLDLISEAIRAQQRVVIGNHNLHSIYLFHRDPKMRLFYEKVVALSYIDGMPLVFWGQLLGKRVRRAQRITFVDWGPILAMHAAQRGWRVFYLGGKPGVADLAADRLKGRFPGLMIRTHHGYFSPAENEAVLGEIADFGTHVLLVGMGMPKQEHWIVDNADKIKANIVVAVGAGFNYIAGVIPTPPRWMGEMGLEWLYRLLSEPRRLWRRYLVEPLFLIPYALRDLFSKR